MTATDQAETVDICPSWCVDEHLETGLHAKPRVAGCHTSTNMPLNLCKIVHRFGTSQRDCARRCSIQLGGPVSFRRPGRFTGVGSAGQAQPASLQRGRTRQLMSAHSNGAVPDGSNALQIAHERTLNMAIGMVMHLFTVNFDDARQVLAAESVRSGRTIAQVAAALVDTKVLRQPGTDVDN